MAMSMQELFYGEREPAYFVHYGRQTSIPDAQHSRQVVPQARSGHTVSTFDLMVAMCCTRCEEQVQEALLGLRGVRDVVCDRYNQRVTITGHVDPVQALKRVKNGATLCSRSSYSTRRYESNSSSLESHRTQQNNRERASYADHYNRSSRENSYSRSRCPPHQDSGAVTHYVSVDQSFATRIEMEC